MRLLLFLPVLLLVACADEQPVATTKKADTMAAPAVARPAVPMVRSFYYETPEVLAVVEGAGCAFSRVGNTAPDSVLFASSSDAVICVGNTIQVLKEAGYEERDSRSTGHYENSLYRVRVQTVVDTVYEAGASSHGEMTVTEKASGGTVTIPIEGGCGC